MWKTAVFLLITIVVIPFIAFRFDEPLSVLQGAVLIRLTAICLGMSLLCFIVSSFTSNYSQVDKLWSIMPVIYTWMIAIQSGSEPRLILMAVLVSLWGIRLSYNFWKKGGYSLKIWIGKEDYRWKILQERPEFQARWKWVIFNFFFISCYQMSLILLITLPAVRSMEGRKIGPADAVVGTLMLLFILIETIADRQQWNFQLRKHMNTDQAGNHPEESHQGFIQTGLWKWVRHPNYAAEQAIWVVFYFFSVAASCHWLNWSVIGAILLILLFRGSSSLSESISSGKYPGYAGYRKQVPRFIPFRPFR